MKGLQRRSQGAVLLCAVGRTQAEIARDMGRSRSLVGHWRTGERDPSTEDQAEIERLYKVPRASWTTFAALATPPPDELDDETIRSVRDEALASLVRAKRLVKSSESHAERCRAERQASDALKILHRCQLDEERLTGSQLWREILSAIREGLRKYPEARQEVQARLRALRLAMSGVADDHTDA